MKKLIGNIRLNILALFIAAAGFVNTILAWKIYGTTFAADAWMLSLTIVAAMCLIAQLGVEQYAVYAAEAVAESDDSGRKFKSDALSWSAGYGLLFGLMLFLLSGPLTKIFAVGYSEFERTQVVAIFTPLLVQVVLAPSMYVIKQQLLLDGKALQSMLINSSWQIAQLFVLLIILWRRDVSPLDASLSLAGVSAAIGLPVIFSNKNWRFINIPHWRDLIPFIRSSAAIRATHSVHNFLVVLITNSALSLGPVGTVSTFQYAKKIADGLSGIAIGPHLNVYHAEQAHSWAKSKREQFFQNIGKYLRHGLPMLALSLIAFAAIAYFASQLKPEFEQRVPKGIFPILAVLSLWQILISLETIPVGVLVMARKSGSMLAINLSFAAVFYVALNVLNSYGNSALQIAGVSLGCQLISSVAYFTVARRVFLEKYPS